MKNLLFPASSRWGIFLITAVVMLFITAIVINLIQQILPDLRIRTLADSVAQGILLFILPVWFTWKLTSDIPYREIGVTTTLTSRAALWIVILYLVSYPAINQTVWWNENMQLLPSSCAGIEEKLRQWEDNAAVTTNAILSSTKVLSLIVNVLIIGVFTGFAEEFFFRAGIQRMMIKSGVRPAVTIISAAVIFSIAHFQFYGFIPRLLLGALFGYVYYRTGSLWASATLHALNNSLIVIYFWLHLKGLVSEGLDYLFVTKHGFPWPFSVSLFLTVACVYLYNIRTHGIKY